MLCISTKMQIALCNISRFLRRVFVGRTWTAITAGYKKAGRMPLTKDSKTIHFMAHRIGLAAICFLVALALTFQGVVPAIASVMPSTRTTGTASLTTEHFTVQADPPIGGTDGIAAMAESIYDDMTTRYRYEQTKKIELRVFTDRKKFLVESPSEDAAGYAHPSESSIAILLDAGNMRTTLAHEINHIIFIQGVQQIGTVPQWFIEGLAIYESQPGVEVAEIEKYALAQDLPDVVGSRSVVGPAELKDYAQGYMLVGFIVNKYGRDALYDIIDRLHGGQDFDSSVLESLVVSPQELNDEWKSYARNQLIYIWLLQLQDMIWYFASALFLVAGVVAYIRKRKQLAGYRDDDDYDASDDDSLWDENEFAGHDFGDGAKL